MSVQSLVLFYFACGAVTFPLTLIAVRFVASLAPDGRFSRVLEANYEKALTVSIMVWIVGALVFYGVSLHFERQKPCDEQRTNQLTYECRKLYGQVE